MENTPKIQKKSKPPFDPIYWKYISGLYRNVIPLLFITHASGPKLHGINDKMGRRMIYIIKPNIPS
jgi:hypothetical protein